MGFWRTCKSWIKRTVLRIALKFARTRVVRFARKIARASAVPLAITGGAAAVGAGVASAVAFPLGFGALIGAAIGIAGMVVRKMYLQYEERTRSRQRMRLSYTVWSKKEKSTSGRTYVVETSARRF